MLVTSIFTSVIMPVETDAVVVRCRRLLDEDSASGLTVRIAQILMRRAAEGESGGSNMADEFTLQRDVEKCFSHRDTNAGEDRCA